MCDWYEDDKDRIDLMVHSCFNPSTAANPITVRPFKFIQNAGETEVDRIIAGIYIHPVGIPMVLGWVSPAYGIKISMIVNEAMGLNDEQ